MRIPSAHFDVDADALRFIVAASLTNSIHIGAVNYLTKSLKATGLWSMFYAIYPFVGGNATAHSKNLKSASYTITWTNGPTQDSNGVTGNGSTQYGNCVGLTGNSVVPHLCGLTIYNRTTTSASSGTFCRQCGIVTATAPTRNYSVEYVDVPGFEGNRGCLGEQANIQTDSSTTERTGTLSVNRTSSTDFKAYDDGSQYLSTTTSDSSTIPSLDFYVLAVNLDGSAAFPSPDNLAFFAVHDAMTATQAGILSGILTKYQTALSRNV